MQALTMRDPEPVQIETALQHVTLFDGLPPAEISQMTLSARRIHADKGDTLFHKGDVCTGLHVLLHGRVKQFVSSLQGDEKVVELVEQGEVLGEGALFTETPHIVSAQALSESVVLHVAKPVVLHALRRSHRFTRKVLAGIAMRQLQLLTDIEAYALCSGKQRVIDYLLREAGRSGQAGCEAAIRLPVNKSVIASRLNVTQEHFSRILHELFDLGLIKVAGRKICIPSLPNLKRHSPS